MLHYFIYFATINFYKNYFIIIIIVLFINNFFVKIILIFYVPEWSLFGVILTPDTDKVEECNKRSRLAIHFFAKCDHKAFSLDWVCYLKLEMNPRDGSNFF